MEPLTPRPGWTQEHEYIALSAEFLAVEENRDRLAEQLRGAVEALRVVADADPARAPAWDPAWAQQIARRALDRLGGRS